MPISFTPTYTNKKQFAYDVALSTGKLDVNTFNNTKAISSNEADKYLAMVAGTAGKTSDTFNWNDYKLLSGTENQSLYLYQTYYADKNETATEKNEETGEEITYNVYDRNQQYLDYVIQQAKDQKTYESLSGFEKTMANIGGVLADTANAIYGTIEGVLDAITLVGGALADVVTVGQFHEQISEGTKWAITQDVTGTGALQNAINDFKSKYTSINRNDFLKFVDEVAVGIGQMVPLFIPGGQVAVAGKLTAGSLTYMSSLAGKTAQDAIQKNPDIDIWSLTGYTAAITAVEYGTEWLSGKIFGGADVMGSKMLGTSMRQTGGWLARIGLDFVSEAFEESISEFVDSLLDMAFIGGDSKIASLEEILYAGLIGGVTGALITGGSIAGTRRLAVTESGDLVRYKDIKKSGMPYKRVSRIATINLQESLNQARTAMRENAVEDFYVKYEQQGLTREQAQTQHEKEYNNAVEQKAKTDKTISDAVAVLSKVLEWGGEEKFIKAAELANYTIEQKSQLLRKYSEYTPSSNEKLAIVEKLVQNKNPGSNAKINENLTAGQLKIQDTFKQFGIDLYYADYNEADGNDKYHDPVIDDKTVVLDMRDFENASYGEVLDKIGKKTLVRTLQYKSDVLSKENIIKLQRIISKTTNYLDSTFDDVQELDREDVSQLSDADLKVYAEKQANTLAQMLLFDELTINKLFMADTNIFKKMYNWLGKTKKFFENFGRKNELNKRQYHTVLETMKKYQDAIADTSPNEKYMNDAADDVGVDAENKERIAQRFNPNTKSPLFEHWAYIPMSKTKRAQDYMNCMNELTNITSGRFTFDDAFNSEIYNPDVVAAVYARMQQGDTFQRALQDYLAENYDMMIDQRHEQLVEVTTFKEHVSAEYKQAVRDFRDGKITLDMLQRKFPTVGHIFEMDFIKSTYNDENNQTLFNWRLNFVSVNRADYVNRYGNTNPTQQTVTVLVDPNQQGAKKITEVTEMEHTIFHETQHVIANWMNLQQGGSVDNITDGLMNPMNDGMVKRLWNTFLDEVSWDEAIRNKVYTNVEMRKKVAQYLYSNLAGELLAESTGADPTSIFGNYDYFDIFYSDGSFRIVGRGKYIGFMFNGKYNQANLVIEQQRYKKTTPLDEVSGNTTEEFEELKTKRSWENGLQILIDQRNIEEYGKKYVSGVGDEVATNEAIKIIYPDNEYATTVEYVDNVRDIGLAYALMYREIKTKLQPDSKANFKQPHTFEEVRNFVDLALQTHSEWQDKYEEFINQVETASKDKGRRVYLNNDFDYSMNNAKKTLIDLYNEAKNETRETSLEEDVGENRKREETLSKQTDDDVSSGSVEADISYDVWDNFEKGVVEETTTDNFIQRFIDKLKEVKDSPKLFDVKDQLKKQADTIKETLGEKKYEQLKSILDKVPSKVEIGNKYIIPLKKQLKKFENRLTEEQKTRINVDTSEFSLNDYKQYVKDLRQILNDAPKQQIIEVKQKETTQEQPVVEEKPAKTKAPSKKKTLRLYHGTNATFDKFDISKAGTNQGHSNLRGVYFSDSEKRAKEYGKNVIKSDVQIENIYDDNKSPKENGINAESFVKKYIPSFWDSEKNTIEEIQQGYMKEKMESKHGIHALLNLAIDKNPSLTESQIFLDLGFDTILQDGDYIVMNPENISIIKEEPVVEEVKEKPVTKKTKREELMEDVDKTLGLPTLTKEEKQKAKEQTIKPSELKIDDTILNKRTEIKNIMDMEDVSQYQGDTTNHNYTPAETKTIKKHADFFESITSAELQPLLQSLAIELTDAASQAARVLLTKYAYNEAYSQFEDIKEFALENNRLSTTYGASQMGSMSQVYGKRQVTEAINEVEIQTGKSLKIPEATVLKALDNKYDSIKEYGAFVQSEMKKLNEEIKKTKDAYTKKVLKDKLMDYRRIMEAIDSDDFAGILDGVLAQLENTEENVVQNQQKMSDICQMIVDFLLENSTIEDGKVTIGKKPSILSPSAKEKIMNFWSGLTTFRYLAMLSSPKTAAKNAVSNTLVATKALLDDAIAGKMSKSHILEQESQVSFTGEYNEAFSNEVEKRYKARVEEKTKGDRYYKNQINKIKADYAKSKNPLLKKKLFAKIDALEKKMLQDKPWTQRRAMRNLKNTLAGGAGAILNECTQWLKAGYRGSIPAHKITREQLLTNIRKTNPELADLYDRALNGDKIAVLDLGEKLKVSLLDLKNNPNNIIDVSIERANELFFKTDNWYTTVRGVLSKKHPGTAAVLDLIFPFMRTTINTSAYIINHSPIGIAKGIYKMLQTKAVYRTDLSDAINDYYKQQFMNMKQAEYDEKNKNAKEKKAYRFIQKDYDEWFSENVPQEVQRAINSGNYKQLLSIYNRMIEDAKISPGIVGASNPYIRAQAFERLSQGLTGTAMMIAGAILAALTGVFDYDDDDDYLGAIIRIGDLKIPLDDLAPFTTIFTVGAMFTSSDNWSDNISRTLKTLADQSLFSIMDSAIAYSTDVWDFMGNQMINVTQQFIPSILKNIAKIADNSKKDKSGNWGINLLKTTASNLPLFSYLVPNKINPYTGENEKYYEGGIFEALINQVSPISFRIENQSQFEKDAIKYDAVSKRLSGRFTINDKEYNVTGKTKEDLAKYRAKYLQTEYDKIANGNQLVTVEDNKGKKITTTYNRLSDEQKANVLKSLYTKATNITKIKYWIDRGNVYYTSNRDEYTRLRKTITNGIYYSASWRKSKFVER